MGNGLRIRVNRSRGHNHENKRKTESFYENTAENIYLRRDPLRARYPVEFVLGIASSRAAPKLHRPPDARRIHLLWRSTPQPPGLFGYRYLGPEDRSRNRTAGPSGGSAHAACLPRRQPLPALPKLRSDADLG